MSEELNDMYRTITFHQLADELESLEYQHESVLKDVEYLSSEAKKHLSNLISIERKANALKEKFVDRILMLKYEGNEARKEYIWNLERNLDTKYEKEELPF